MNAAGNNSAPGPAMVAEGRCVTGAGNTTAATGLPRVEPDPVPCTDPGPKAGPAPARPRELGGPAGLEPTRYGDWERSGRCIDF